MDRGVHWHVLRDVEFWTDGQDAATIDYVAADGADGTVRGVHRPGQDHASPRTSQPDIDAIKAAASTRDDDLLRLPQPRRATPSPNPRTGVDYELSSGRIDPTLPYIKREGMRILWAAIPDDATADAAIDRLATSTRLNYPEVAAQKARRRSTPRSSRSRSCTALTATPEMKVTAATYPDNLGHMDFPGCFRCHDGGHFLVEDGVATKRDHPVDLRHVPHVPADRPGGRQPAAGRAARARTTTACGSSTTGTWRHDWTRAGPRAASATRATTA